MKWTICALVSLALVLCVILHAVQAPLELEPEALEPTASSETASVISAARLDARHHVVIAPVVMPADLPPPGLPTWVPGLLGHGSRALPGPRVSD